MERFTFKKWFEFYKPDEETTTICVDNYIQIIEGQESNHDCIIEKQHHYLVGDAIDRLAEYEDAEDQRLLWKLPCKIGDIVYQVDKANKKVLTQKVLKIELEIWGEGSHSMRIWFETAGSCFGIHFGKTVFFNKAEAMQALEHYVSRGSA